jgi:hypothetical protein
MESYDWEKNKAIVDRLYYSERIVEGSTVLALGATAINLLFIQKNYFSPTMKARIPRIWIYWALLNSTCLFVLLKPLTKEEVAV